MATKQYDVFIRGREKLVSVTAETVYAGTELTFKIGDDMVAEFAVGSWDGYRVSPDPVPRKSAEELSRS